MDHRVLAVAAASGLDDDAIDSLCKDLKAQLAAHRANRQSSAPDAKVLTDGGISNLLREHVEINDPSNVAVLAMTMWHSCRTISPAPLPDPLTIPAGFRAEWHVFGAPQWLHPMKFSTPCSALNAIQGLSAGAFLVRTLSGGRREFHGDDIGLLAAAICG